MNIKKLTLSLTLGLGLTLGLLWTLGGGLLAVRAADFSVDVTNDENDGCTPGGCSLREAIIAANGNGQADTISLGLGTYTLSIAGADEDAAATGDLDITDALTITGAGPNQTTIDADGIDRVFDIQPGAGTVVISGVTIINGNYTGWGGGIYNYDADLTLINTTVISNAAGLYGGGVCSNRGNVTLSGTQILSNTALRGGGVYVAYSPAIFTQADGSIVAYNHTTGSGSDGGGGGVYLGSASATLTSGQILSNTASNRGGGLYVGSGVATLSGVQILSNTASTDGGGLFVGSGAATLSGGQILSNSAVWSGGGVYIMAGSATLSGGQILGNEADDGGGLWVGNDTAIFTQTGDSVIAYNTARSATGGGGGVSISQGNATLSGGQILSNTASSRGGGMYIWYGSATLNGGQVLSNSAGYGGGVYVLDSDATFTQTGASLIAHNTATTSGGGVYIRYGSATLQGGQIISNSANYGGGAYLDQPSADLSLSRGHIVSNTATSSGGGAYIQSGTTTVSRTIISGNNAPSGGGIFKDDGTLTLVNTTLSHNAAYNGSGGGLRSDAGETSLAYLTVASNTATSGGGGIHAAGGTIHLQDTIVAYNDTANCNTGLTSDGYNLDSGDTCGLNATGDQQNTDPKLGPLADNGGSGEATLTHALLDGSPAIDGGDCIAGITTDQRGVTRPQGDTCDIGAYEYAAGGAVYLPIILRD